MNEKIKQLIEALIEKTEKREMYWRSCLGYETVVGDYHFPLTAVDDDDNVSDEGDSIALSITLLFDIPIVWILRDNNEIKITTKLYGLDDKTQREVEGFCNYLIERIEQPRIIGILPSEGNNETICKILRKLIPNKD